MRHMTFETAMNLLILFVLLFLFWLVTVYIPNDSLEKQRMETCHNVTRLDWYECFIFTKGLE